MTEFLQTCLTFPTVIYSVLLAFCVVYWLLAMTGLFHAHAMDGLLTGHAPMSDGLTGHHDVGDPLSSVGLLAKLGLGRVPVMIVFTVLFFLCWLATYFLQLLVLEHFSGTFRVLVGLAVVLGALVPGMLVTSVLLRPLSRWLATLQPPADSSLLGRVGTVISPVVDGRGGRAEFDDGGAGLILQVRSSADVSFARGQRVVLLSYDPLAHTHDVISEADFNNR